MPRQTRSRLFRWSSLLLLIAPLAGCGDGFRELINPPGASVQQLRAPAQGPWMVTLRLQNYSNVRTEFSGVDLEFSIGGARAGKLALGAGLTVEADSVELVQLELTPSDAARGVLAAPSVRDTGIAYRLEGKVATSEPRGGYPLLYDSRLAPVPGRPGEFR